LKVRYFANNIRCTSAFLQQQPDEEVREEPAANQVSIFDIGIPTFAGLDSTVANNKKILNVDVNALFDSIMT